MSVTLLLLLSSHKGRLGRGRQGDFHNYSFPGIIWSHSIIIRFRGLPVVSWTGSFMSINYAPRHFFQRFRASCLTPQFLPTRTLQKQMSKAPPMPFTSGDLFRHQGATPPAHPPEAVRGRCRSEQPQASPLDPSPPQGPPQLILAMTPRPGVHADEAPAPSKPLLLFFLTFLGRREAKAKWRARWGRRGPRC